MLALALYDYINDVHESNSYEHQQQPQQLVSFRRGTVLDVLQSNGGWSYGRVVQKPFDEDLSVNSNTISAGWFPTSYVSSYESPTPTALPVGSSVNKVSGNLNVSTVSVLDHTETSEDNEGFFGTPMGGYIEPEEEALSTPRHDTDDDRDVEILPPGVATVPVPDRRQFRVITIPKNLVTNIATTTSKVTNRLHFRRQNHSSSTTTPAVYVSPS